MNITVKKGNLADTKTQAVVLYMCEGEKEFSQLIAGIDQKTGGLIRDVMKKGDFEGKPSQVCVIIQREITRQKESLLSDSERKKNWTWKKSGALLPG